jgi:hypothetical protein
MRTQEEENEIYRLAEGDAGDVYEKIINTISQADAESIAHVLQNGTEAEVEELSAGLWEIFKNK